MIGASCCCHVTLLILLLMLRLAFANINTSLITSSVSTSSSFSQSSSLTSSSHSSKEKKLQALEHMFLKNIGLTRRPRVSADYAVPAYMLDLYRSHKDNSDEPNMYLKLKGNGAISANTVRSFVHTEADSNYSQHPRCSWIHFGISTIPENEIIVGAELRIFVDSVADSRTAGSEASHSAVEPSQKGTTSNGGALFRIEVYELMQPRSADGSVISRLLDTRVVTPGNSSWSSFDIRPAVLRWKRGERNNHGLEIRLVSNTPTLLIDNHVRLRRSIHLQEKEWALQRPLLVTYTNDGSTPSSTSASSSSQKSSRRRKRQTADDDNKNKKRKKNKNKRKRKKKGNKNVCKRHALYVNFKDVGWDDWIVAPSGYSAYYCHGDCMAPLSQFTKASHHAMLQARVYKVNPTAVPMVCCIPSVMQPVIMLYSDEKGRTILKSYQDMIVAECSCK